jgi:hypothetical protein
MKKRLVFLILITGLALTLTGCDWLTQLFWPKVELDDAKVAWEATGQFIYNAYYNTPVQVDNGSDPNYQKWKNNEGTLTWEFRMTSGSYPATETYTSNGWKDTASGYVIDGTAVMNYTSSSKATADFKLDFEHDSKPVKHIEGTLTMSASTTTGSLKFNNDEYQFYEFSAP